MKDLIMQQQNGANINGKQHEFDKYCWTCHHDGTDIHCSTCVRSFHLSAICAHTKSVSEDEMKKWRCHECMTIEKGIEQMKKKEIDLKHFKDILDYVYKIICQHNRSVKTLFMNIQYPKETVVNTMDIAKIGKKITFGAYSCCEEFWSDIKWIVHNTKIYHADNNVMIKMANSLHDLTKEELYCIQMCHDCYTNLDNEWFEMPCPNPHLLVWAKQRSYPYWPAKLMRFNAEDNTVDVYYFGIDHKRAVLPVKNCLLYSNSNPSVSIGKGTVALATAIKEADRYIKKLIDKFGSFNHAKQLSFLNGQMLERHLYEMIPGAWKELGKSEIPPPIPIETAASATKSRRISLPARELKRFVSQMPYNNLTSERILTRRMSAVVRQSVQAIEEHTKVAQITTTAAQHRQSDECERPSFIQIASTTLNTVKNAKNKIKENRKILTNEKCSDAEASSPKVMKIGNGQQSDDILISKSRKHFEINISNSINDSVFKVPAVPKKGTVSMTQSLSKTKKLTSSNQTVKTLPSMESTMPNLEFSSEMLTMCKTVIQKNAIKLAENIRCSLADTLLDFLKMSTVEEKIKMLQEQLETQRRDSAEIMQGLRAKNENLMTMTMTLTEQLDKSRLEISELNDRLRLLSTKNAYMTSTVAKLQVTNIDLLKKLKLSEAKNAELKNVNKNVSKVNLFTTNENMKWDNNLNNRDVNQQSNASHCSNCELNKEKAYQQCARIITEIKKKAMV